MALIRCAECGNAVSTSAASCPKCGAPIASAASSATSMAPPTPFIPFWNTSRIVGAVLCSIGALTLVFGFVYMTSLESQFRRNFQDWDPVSYISLVVGAMLLLVGISILAGAMRLLNRAGQIIFIVLLLTVPVFRFTLVLIWLPFVIPFLKANYALNNNGHL